MRIMQAGRWVVPLALVTAILMAQAASGANSAVSRRSATTLSITYISSQAPGFEKIIAAFQAANPDMTVKKTSASFDQISPLVLTQLQSGNAPDVFWATAGTATTPLSVIPLARQGRIEDLSAEPWVKRLSAAQRAAVSVGGKVYGSQYDALPYVLVYNADLLQRAKLSVPKTFAGLLQMCRRIRQISGGKSTPIALPGGSPVTMGGFMVSGIATSAVTGPDPTWNTKRLRGKTTFASSPLWRRAIQQFFDMKQANCFQQDAAASQQAASVSQFMSGQAVMMAGTVNITGLFRSIDPSFDFGAFVIPGTKEKDTMLGYSLTDGLVVNAASPNKDAAKAFLRFVADPRTGSTLTRVNGTVLPSDFAAGNFPTYLSALERYPRAKPPRVRLNLDRPWPTASTRNALGTALQGVLTGQVTSVDAVLKAMDASWNK